MRKQAKKEKISEFKNVKYILTSNMRSKLLIAMYEKSKNLESLRAELKKPSATILHGLKELEEINLVSKYQKRYQLTSNGFLIATNLIKLIENWNSINKNKFFWDDHNLNDIPEKSLKKVHLLKDATYTHSTTSNLSNAFNTFIKLISESPRLKMIIPIYSENHFKQLIRLLNENKLKRLDLIISEDIYRTLRRHKYFKLNLLENNKVKITCIENNIKLFLTFSKTFMSLTLFFKDGHYDDSQILSSNTNDAIKWASELYSYYQIRGDKI